MTVLPTIGVNNGFGSLVVDWAAVIDNGEGSGRPHGPLGRIHILAYEADTSCPGKRKSYSRALRHVILKCPSSEGSTKNEWDDGDEIRYHNLELFRWRSELDAVLLFICESDPSGIGSMIFVPGRAHDPLFCWRVSRSSTLDASRRHAEEKAVIRARQRGGDALERSLLGMGAWTEGIRIGIPKMFLQLKTDTPGTFLDEN